MCEHAKYRTQSQFIALQVLDVAALVVAEQPNNMLNFF
jgi:hypothetical protein